jgi:hypothetical protein
MDMLPRPAAEPPAERILALARQCGDSKWLA